MDHIPRDRTAKLDERMIIDPEQHSSISVSFLSSPENDPTRALFIDRCRTRLAHDTSRNASALSRVFTGIGRVGRKVSSRKRDMMIDEANKPFVSAFLSRLLPRTSGPMAPVLFQLGLASILT